MATEDIDGRLAEIVARIKKVSNDAHGDYVRSGRDTPEEHAALAVRVAMDDLTKWIAALPARVAESLLTPDERIRFERARDHRADRDGTDFDNLLAIVERLARAPEETPAPSGALTPWPSAEDIDGLRAGCRPVTK